MSNVEVCSDESAISSLREQILANVSIMAIVPKLEIITRSVVNPLYPKSQPNGTEAVVISGQVVVIVGPDAASTHDALFELLKATEKLLANNPGFLTGISDGEGRQICGTVFNQRCLNRRIDYSE